MLYTNEGEKEDKIFNLTLDDVIECFEDINDNKYSSVFENSTFLWMKSLHEEYGVIITCYVYYEDGKFDLSQCTDKYKEEFEANSEWLRFGFHTLNGNTSYEEGDIATDYLKTVSELKRIVGNKSIDNVIRLQGFQGSYDGVTVLFKLEDEPVIGLFTTDDSRQSYYLGEDESEYIYCHDKLYKDECYFISTDLRMEYVDNIKKKLAELSTEAWNNQIGDLVIFSHERALSLEVKENIEKMCKYAVDNGYKFVFFEDSLK